MNSRCALYRLIKVLIILAVLIDVVCALIGAFYAWIAIKAFGSLGGGFGLSWLINVLILMTPLWKWIAIGAISSIFFGVIVWILLGFFEE
jgi:hypothetical protein